MKHVLYRKGKPVLLVEAPRENDALLYGVRNLRDFTTRVVAQEAFDQGTTDLRESFKSRYLSEGMDEAAAESMAERAAGPPPSRRLPFREIPLQEPDSRLHAKGATQTRRLQEDSFDIQESSPSAANRANRTNRASDRATDRRPS